VTVVALAFFFQAPIAPERIEQFTIEALSQRMAVDGAPLVFVWLIHVFVAHNISSVPLKIRRLLDNIGSYPRALLQSDPLSKLTK
jgi:hypothetical protein